METPQKIIDRQIQQKTDFIERFKKTPVIQVVCGQVGISRATFYRWIKEDPVFYQQYLEAEVEGREFMGDAMESHLIQLAKDGNLGAIIFYLKHNRPRYSESIRGLPHQQILEIAEYIKNLNDQQDDSQFLSNLFKKKVPMKISRYIVQIMRTFALTKKQVLDNKNKEFKQNLLGIK